MVEVALAAAVSLHRVEAKLERRDVLGAVCAADGAVHRALDRQRARLDQLRPLVDGVELGEALDAAGVDGHELDEVPVVLHRERDPLLVGERPHDGGIDRAAQVRVQLGQAPAAQLIDDGAALGHVRLAPLPDCGGQRAAGEAPRDRLDLVERLGAEDEAHVALGDGPAPADHRRRRDRALLEQQS